VRNFVFSAFHKSSQRLGTSKLTIEPQAGTHATNATRNNNEMRVEGFGGLEFPFWALLELLGLEMIRCMLVFVDLLLCKAKA
jgi:hypothetical protein